MRVPLLGSVGIWQPPLHLYNNDTLSVLSAPQGLDCLGPSSWPTPLTCAKTQNHPLAGIYYLKSSILKDEHTLSVQAAGNLNLFNCTTLDIKASPVGSNPTGLTPAGVDTFEPSVTWRAHPLSLRSWHVCG